MVNSKFRSQVLESRLEVREIQLQLAAHESDAAIWSHEPSTGALTWTCGERVVVADATGTPPSSLEQLFELVHSADQARLRRAFQQALQMRRDFSIDFRTSGSPERRMTCSARVHASALDRNQAALSGLLRDIPETTTRTAGQLSVRAGSIAHRMQSLRDLERSTLTNMLQADVAQNLTSIKQQLETLMGNPATAPEIRKQLAELARAAEQGLDAVRCTIFDLQPPGVAELGFTGALERYATEQTAAAGIKLSLSIPAEALPFSLATLEALFVVARTGIDNVVRHSQAKNLAVAVKLDEAALVLKIVDDGIGIAEKDLMKDGAFSLFASSERLASSGGSLSVTGTPATGTALEASIPRQLGRQTSAKVTPLRVA
jgi:signal transduction histidine kinase